MTHRTTVVVLAITFIVGTVAPVAAIGAPGDPTAQPQTPPVEPVNVTVGQQLSTVMVEVDSDVRSDVEEASFELRLETAGEQDRAEATAARARELAQRAVALNEAYEAAARAHGAGELTDSEFAARIATLNARAEDLERSVRRLRSRAGDVSALELRAAGFESAELRTATARLEPLTGTGADALLRRFTGRTEGEVRIETGDGLEIEVEGEAGELSREIERPRDDDANITVGQADALGTARAALGAPPEGNWSLRRASVHEESGYYRFRFALTGAAPTGEAEVRVDGSSGEVFRLETEIEPPDDDDDDRDRDRDELVLLVVGGTPGPNETVTVRASRAGAPVADAAVTLNGAPVGRTDANGTVTLRLPTDEAELRVAAGGADGELEFEFDEDDGETERLRRDFDVTVREDAGTVTLRLTYAGSPVEGASVVVEDRAVGTTDADGRVGFATADGDELDVEVRKRAFVAELEFERRQGSLVLVEMDFDADEDRERETDGEDDSDRSDDDDDDREADRVDDGELRIEIVEGDRAPGGTVTVSVTLDGSPVEGATVRLNDDRVGTTDGDGLLRLRLPGEDRAEIVAEYGDEDAELELRFDDDDDEG